MALRKSPSKSGPRTAREVAQKPTTNPRPPVTFSQRLGAPAASRVPWESPPISISVGGKELPTQGRDVTYAQAAGTTEGISDAEGDGASIALGVGEASGEAGMAFSLRGSAVGLTRGNVLARYRAKKVIASSSWTGRRSIQEQVTVVEALAPFTRDSVAQLVAAVEQKRLNDPATHDALEALKELHQVLGELIALAEAHRPMKRVWKRFEQGKEKLANALWDGAQVMLVAPALAMGAATFLSVLSGFPVSEGMVTALCAASMTKDALLTVAKNR